VSVSIDTQRGRARASLCGALFWLVIISCRPPLPAGHCDDDDSCPFGHVCTETHYCLATADADAGVDAGADAGADAGVNVDAGADAGRDDGGTAQPPPFNEEWWDVDWTKRLRLRFYTHDYQHSLERFSFPVQLDPTSFDYGGARPDGADLRFVDHLFNVLPHQVERWNPQGRSTLWVTVSDVPAHDPARALFIYFGNPAADTLAAGSAWPAEYALVELMGEGSGAAAVSDSSSHGHAVERAGSSAGRPTGPLGYTITVGAGERISVPALSAAGFPGDEGTLVITLRSDDWSSAAGDLFDVEDASRSHLHMKLDGDWLWAAAEGPPLSEPASGSGSLSNARDWETIALAWERNDQGTHLSLYHNGMSRGGTTDRVAPAWAPTEQRFNLFNGLDGVPFFGEVEDVMLLSTHTTPSWNELQWRARQDLMVVLERAPVRVEPEERDDGVEPATGAVLLYEFDEGEGDVVHDSAEVGPAIDLHIPDPNAVRWHAGAMEIVAPTRIESTLPPDKLRDACSQTQEITVEAWVQPDHDLFYGPARILSVGAHTNNAYYMLGQDLLGPSRDHARYVMRIRTDQTGSTGNDNGSDTTPPTTSDSARDLPQRARTHVVFTRSSGSAPRACSYINGARSFCKEWPGGFIDWSESPDDPNEPQPVLRLANEYALYQQYRRAWLGTYFRVAIYCRALSEAEIARNFQAGSAAR